MDSLLKIQKKKRKKNDSHAVDRTIYQQLGSVVGQGNRTTIICSPFCNGQ